MTGDSASRESNPASASPSRLHEQAKQETRTANERDLRELSPGQSQSPLHDLRAYQIELECRTEELHRAREELHRLSERLGLAQRAAAAGVWDWNVVSGKIEWTDELFELFGLDPKADVASFEAWRRVLHPEDRQAAEERIDHAIQEHLPLASEYRIMYADGQVRWINALGHTIYDATGRPVRMLGICIDITERKQSEQEREAKIELLRLLNSTPDSPELLRAATAFLQRWSGCEAVGIRLRQGEDYPYCETRGFPPEFILAENRLCTVDQQGKPVRNSQGNPLIECMCGNVICGRCNPSKPFFTKNGSFWTNCTTKLLAGTTEADRQSRTRNRCNGEGYESVALIPLRAIQETFGLLQFNDKREGRFTPALISLLERVADNLAIGLAQHKASEGQRQSESNYRFLFEHMLNGLAFCKMHFENGRPVDFTYLSTNSAFETLTGLSNVVGKRATEVIPGIRESDADLLAIYGRVALTGEPERFEIHLVALDMWFSVSVYSPLREHFIAIFDVITERKRAEAAQAQLEDQLRHSQKLEALGQLSAGVAHDFGNLLTVARAQIALAESVAGDAHAVREPLQLVSSVVEQAISITHSLRTFSQGLPTEHKLLSLRELLEDMRTLLEHCLPARVQLKLQTPDNKPCWVLADQTQLQQVILNLAINARDAMPQGGTLSVSITEELRPDTPGTPDSCREAPRLVVLSVTDTGAGMPEEVISRIFEPFYTTKLRGQGTGLGLSIVHGIVRDHGGHISVQSHVDAGTVFTITLPAAEAPGNTPDATHPPARTQGHGELVVVAAPNPYLRGTIASSLESHGYQVAFFGDEQGALAGFIEQAGQAQLLIVDACLAGQNGPDYLGRVRECNPDVPAIILAGTLAQDASSQSVAHAAILREPYTLIELMSTVATLLGNGKQEE